MDYDINDLIKKYENKDFIIIIKELTDEVGRLDGLYRNIKKGKQDSEYQLIRYRDYAGDFLFFLNTGMTPGGIGLDGLRHFLPIIKNLVDKGQLKKEVLNRFD